MNYGEHVENLPADLWASVVEDRVRESVQIGPVNVSESDRKASREIHHLLEDLLQFPLESEIEIRSELVGVPLFGGSDILLCSRAELDSQASRTG